MSCDSSVVAGQTQNKTSPPSSADLPVIAVDVDEVLCPFVPALASWHNREYGTELSVANFHSYTFTEVWGGSTDDAVVKISRFFASSEFAGLSPLPGAGEALRALAPHARLVVVTARAHAVAGATRAFLDAHYGGIFADVLHANAWSASGPRESKAVLCARAGAHLLIDDSWHYAHEVAHAGIPTLLFGEYPWNRQEPSSPNVIRVADWHEALREVRARLEDGRLHARA